MRVKYAAIAAVFEGLSLARLPALIRPFSSAKGVIFTLHRVLPERPADFSPNAILQITPEFLEAVILRVREVGLDIVDLDEAIRRIEDDGKTRPFVVFTFDDAYRDNRDFALPILRKHDCPFTLYVPTALVDGVGEVWWQALEDIIAAQDKIAVPAEDGRDLVLDAHGVTAKDRVYTELYCRMRKMPEPERVAMIRSLAETYGFDLSAHCRSLIMDWHELEPVAAEPLCTVGAHTVHHYELAKLPEKDARDEIEGSVAVLKSKLGAAPTHLSYPIGGRTSAGPREYRIAKELGLRSAVTTLPSGLYAGHRDNLTALPRISLNGHFQRRRYIDVFSSGDIFTALGRLVG